jgi:hypothetical protein
MQSQPLAERVGVSYRLDFNLRNVDTLQAISFLQRSIKSLQISVTGILNPRVLNRFEIMHHLRASFFRRVQQVANSIA